MRIRENETGNVSRKNRIITFFLAVFVVISFLLTVFCMVYLRVQIKEKINPINQQYREYNRHYALITRDNKDSLWASVYDNMKKTGEKTDVYVEKFGDNLAVEYSERELMEIAIDSKVDGIIYEGDDSMETVSLISKATAAGIPVITVKNDAVSSARRSFVGISYYNLGTEYGKMILQALDTLDSFKANNEDSESNINVLVLVDKSVQDTSQNITVTALKETISKIADGNPGIEVNTIEIDNGGDFSAEESIRDLFQNPRLPDIIVCLNEVNTVSVYQTIVEQNKVGESVILGYSNSDVVLKAIKKDVIFSTITVDEEQLGSDCVEALNEYIDYGRVSEYYGVDYNIINADNVDSYLGNEVPYEQ